LYKIIKEVRKIWLMNVTKFSRISGEASYFLNEEKFVYSL